MTSGDSVTVTATRKVDTFFTSIFGLDQVTETATARATVESFTTINGPGRDAVGRDAGSYVPGQAYSIYTKATGNANNGALSLPYVSGRELSGAKRCQPVRGRDQRHACSRARSASGRLSTTKTGDNSGPTAQGPELAHHQAGRR